MKTSFVNNSITALEKDLYMRLNTFSKSHPFLGRVIGVPLPLIEVSLESIKMPFIVVERITMTSVNLIGMPFSRNFTPKDTLFNLEGTFTVLLNIPVKILMLPFDLTYQVFSIIINPEKAQPINPEKIESQIQAKNHFVYKYFSNFENRIYSNLNNFSKSNPIIARLEALPIALLDISLESLKMPCVTIEYIARAVINLLGAVFSNNYTLKESLICMKISLQALMSLPSKVAMSPIKLIYQVFAIAIKPQHVQSINYNNPTYRL